MKVGGKLKTAFQKQNSFPYQIQSDANFCQ